MKYIYVRVSTEDQDLNTQISLLRKEAPGARLYQDVVSGSSEKPALLSLMDVLKAGDQLYLYKYDRLSRDASESLYLISKLQKRGVEVISVTEPLDSMSASGKFMLHIFCAVAEYERNLISERTKAKLTYLKSIGKPIGGTVKKGSGDLTDAQSAFLKEIEPNADWQAVAIRFKEEFGKSYKPSTIRRKYFERKKA